MLSRLHPDRIQITFDDHRLGANAGLLLPATLGRGTSACPNSSRSTSTWVMPRAGPTPATR